MPDAELAVDLSIVIPAFNEGSNLAVVVEETVRRLDETRDTSAYELIIVDDGSTDDTALIADNLATLHPRVKVARHAKNLGFGAALRSGFACSTGEFVTVIPADGEVRIDEALKLFSLAHQADLVVSSRVRSHSTPLYRALMTAAFHWFQKTLLRFDPSGMEGIFVARRAVLEATPVRSSTGLFQFELFMRCSQRGRTIRHGVVRITPRLGGQSKVTNLPALLKTFFELWALRWRVARNVE